MCHSNRWSSLNVKQVKSNMKKQIYLQCQRNTHLFHLEQQYIKMYQMNSQRISWVAS